MATSKETAAKQARTPETMSMPDPDQMAHAMHDVAGRTPGPWTTGPNTRDDDKYGILRGGRVIAAVYIPCEIGAHDETAITSRAMADAAFIVTACNAHDANVARIAELEAALKVAAKHVYRAYAESGCIAWQEDAQQVRAALAKIEKE